jgi:hypothetical protein
MCLICVDFERGALKVREARRALGEMRVNLSAEHVREIEERLARAESDEDSSPSSATPKP